MKTMKTFMLTALSLTTALPVAMAGTVSDSNSAASSAMMTESSDSTYYQKLSEIVVTGSNSGMDANLLPYTVSKIGAEQLRASGSEQVLSAISVEVPSLFVTERNILGFGLSTGGSGGIKIRGVGGSGGGVLMMMDGQPQFAGLFSHNIADFYGVEYVDHVEVLRGPGSVLYGSNAMGGVINVITKKVKEDGVQTSLSSQYGSYNTWVSYITNTVKVGRFSSYVNAAYQRTDGSMKGLDFKSPSAYAKLGYEISDNWNVALDYRFLNFKGNDPVYPRLEDPNSTDVYHQNIIRGEASATISNNYARTGGNVHLYYSYGNHFIHDPKYFHSTDDRFGVLAYQNINPWSGATGTIGFDFNRYTGRIPVSGGVAWSPENKATMEKKGITEYSPYITLSQSLADGAVVLNAGVRMANSNLFSTQWVPQGGVVLRPGAGFNIKASLAKGYRNPSMRELYLYPPSNPDLEPENMMNYEVSVANNACRYIGASLTAYFSKGTNMIETINRHNINTGKFYNKGLELSLWSHPTDRITLRGSYSYLHTTLKNLTGAPKNQVYLGLGYKPLDNLTVDADMRYVGSLFLAPGRHRMNYCTVNARISYDVLKWLRLFVNFDNLTNTTYEINNGYVMPGISVIGGFELKFFSSIKQRK